MDIGRREHGEAGVMVVEVVPVEEVAAEGARVLHGAEALGKVRPVLECLELRFAERVVVGDVGPGVRLGDAEVGHQERDWLGGPHIRLRRR